MPLESPSQHAGLFVALATPKGVTNTAFLKTYQDGHLKTVVSSGAFARGTLGARIDSPDPAPIVADFALLFECDKPGPPPSPSAGTAIGKLASDPSLLYTAYYRRMYEYRAREPKRATTGVQIVLANYAGTRRAEFEHWYDRTHLNHMVDTGAYYSAVRYANASAQKKRAESEYLALYITDAEDPLKAFRHMRTFVQGWFDQGLIFEGTVVVSNIMTKVLTSAP